MALVDFVPIREAARRIKKSREYVRKLVDQGRVKARITGGSQKAPWLAVNFSQLERVVETETEYVPPLQRTHQPRKRRAPRDLSNLHPFAATM